MELIISARNKEQKSTDYLPLEEHGISSSIEINSGDGTPKDPYHARGWLRNNNGTKWSGVIHIELPFTKVNPRYFLPAFMYGRNRGEAPQNVLNEFPRLREGGLNRPSSPWWMVRSDRLSHPVALVYDNDKIYGLCASPYFISKNGSKQQWIPNTDGAFYQYGGYTCSLDKGTIGYTLGYENAPWLFIKSHLVKERSPLSDNCFELEPGETVEFSLDLYEYDANSELDINDVIQEVYYNFHQHPRKSSDVNTTVRDLAQAIFKDGWIQEDLNYACQVHEDLNSGENRYTKLTSISWTNGLSTAVPMLISSLRLENESMRQQALSCISNIVNNSINRSSGLPYDACNDGVWSIKGWWFDGMHTPGHSSYVVGQALFYILKAYDYEKRFKNVTHDDWLEFVKEVLVQIEKTKNTDHEYPYIFSEKTGAGIEYDSFSGTWCMAAIAYYCWLVDDQTHLESIKKSETRYYDAYVKRMECYGAPLDTDKAVDSEGILAYLKAIKFLHLITNDCIYLSHMRDALYYEFSFKFCYNSPIQVPPLSRIEWSSCGGSVTSVANPHIHPMSSNIIDELLYFGKYTEDQYFQDRISDIVRWSCQSYNTYDREFDYGKKGWMSERFCYSEGLVTQKYSDDSLASTWFCLMPWASASIIEGFAGDYWDLHTR